MEYVRLETFCERTKVRILRGMAAALVASSSVCANADVARFSPYDDVRVIADDKIVADAAAVRQGGVLREGLLGSFNSLNILSFPGLYPQRLPLIHDSLFVASQQEPNALYGLLAKDIQVAPDFSRARIELDDKARWHDGTPVTAWDIEFTFETVLANSSPVFRRSLGGLTIEVHDSQSFTLTSAQKGDWLWLRAAATFPVHSKGHWSQREPDRATLEPPLGSGPFRIAGLDAGRRLRLEKVADYWASDHPINRNRWNFDAVVSEYFIDPVARSQALAIGEVDIIREADAARWSNVYSGPALERGDIVKSEIRDPSSVAVPALFFNLRRPLFQDERVRKALALSIDIDFLLELTGQVYAPATSYFGSAPWAAVGPPSPAEVALIEPLDEQLPRDFFTSSAPAVIGLNRSERQRLREASELLEAAGFSVQNGLLIDPETGEQTTIELVVSDRDVARRLAPLTEWFAQLGIALDIVTPDASVISQIRATHQFDMIFISLNHSGLPGFLENFFWHSRFKDTGFSIAGLESDVVDALIDKMQSSRDVAEIESAAQAFDRFLRWNALVIPLWQQNEAWFVHRKGLSAPSDVSAGISPAVTWYWE